MWANFYEKGGWGMYPTTLFGFFLVASAVLLLLRPERRYVLPVVTLGIITASSGVLGCATGFINTFLYIQELPAEEQVKIAAIGCAESLNNVVLAFLIIVIASLVATGAAVRAMRSAEPRSIAG